MTTSGFVAGTLVHTDKGLVPIEQLKVGDMVLSKHESGQGEQAYKRVIKTFKSAEKKPVVKVTIDGEKGQMHLFCTPDHPFWSFSIMTDWSWQAAIKLQYNAFSVLLKNGNEADIAFDTSYLIQSCEPEIAFVYDYLQEEPFTCSETYIDFRQQNPVLIPGSGVYSYNLDSTCNWDKDEERLIISLLQQTPEAQFFNNMILKTHREEDIDPIYSNEEQIDDIYRAYRATVYNIELADSHTYYIGKAGILTHDSANITP